jgi:C-terminal processing protease CtpA/Prc
VRPAPITELTPGVWYADLTRARIADFTPMIQTLATAGAVLVDLRGYPTDAGGWLLRHLITASEHDRWMHVAKIRGPFGDSAGWQDFGWDLAPSDPHISGKVIFLTDARAISYAESVMGYVADRKLATIVGAPTAGTNGNVASFTVPSGFGLIFTGMRVTGHDGRARHHLVGITPDVVAAPTIAGLRAGHDEVLERALSLAR